MNILLNGEPHALPEHSKVTDLIEQLALTGQRFAIEINGEIVSRGQHVGHALREGDKVEIVRAIGGG
jgi:sulfur carrier protein